MSPMTHEKYIAEMRRLFEEEKRVHWRIGDRLIDQYGPPGPPGAHADETRAAIERDAEELGQGLDTLLQYRSMAAAFPPSTRVEGASYTAHRAALYTRDPQKVMATAAAAAYKEAAKETKRTGKPAEAKVSVVAVRRLAVQKENQKETAVAISARKRSDRLVFLSHVEAVSRHLRELTADMRAMVAAEEELTEELADVLDTAIGRWETNIGWLRTLSAGGDLGEEIAEYLNS